MHRNKIISALLCAILLSMLFCGCGTSSVVSDPDLYDDEGATLGSNKTQSSELSEMLTSDLSTTLPQDRKLIRQLTIGMETTELDPFVQSLTTSLSEYDGYIASGSLQTRNTRRQAFYTLRVPAEQLDNFLQSIQSIGTLCRKTEQVEDVTLEYVDVESRLTVLRTEQESLLQLLADADSLTSILEIRDRLTQINADIESYTAQLRTLDNQIAYATIELSVEEVERVSVVEEEGRFHKIGRQFVENLSDVWEGVCDFFVFFVSAIPYFLVLAIIALCTWLIIRGILRGCRKRRQKHSSVSVGNIQTASTTVSSCTQQLNPQDETPPKQ